MSLWSASLSHGWRDGLRTSVMADSCRDTPVCVCRVEWSVTYRSFRGSALPVYFFLSLSNRHVVISKQAAAQAETKLPFLFNKSCVAENPLSLFASLHFNHFHHSLFNSETRRCALLLGDTHKNDILCTTASANEMINEWWAEAHWCCTAHSLPSHSVWLSVSLHTFIIIVLCCLPLSFFLLLWPVVSILLLCSSIFVLHSPFSPVKRVTVWSDFLVTEPLSGRCYPDHKTRLKYSL